MPPASSHNHISYGFCLQSRPLQPPTKYKIPLQQQPWQLEQDRSLYAVGSINDIPVKHWHKFRPRTSAEVLLQWCQVHQQTLTVYAVVRLTLGFLQTNVDSDHGLLDQFSRTWSFNAMRTRPVNMRLTASASRTGSAVESNLCAMQVCMLKHEVTWKARHFCLKWTEVAADQAQ